MIVRLRHYLASGFLNFECGNGQKMKFYYRKLLKILKATSDSEEEP